MDLRAMSDLTNGLKLVSSLLRDSGKSWTSATGRLKTWSDEALLDTGRLLAHNHPGLHGQLRKWGPMGFPENTSTYETEHRFWATARPWRVRMERLRDTMPNIDGAGHSPVVLIIDGLTWWAQYGERIETNAGNARSILGTLNLDLLLMPTRLPSGLRFLDATEVEFGDTRALRVWCEPSANFIREAPGMVVLGAAEYALTVHAKRGVLLQCDAYIRGQLGKREELWDLLIDVPIDGGLFTPASLGS